MKKYGWKMIVLLILAVLVLFWLIRAPIINVYLTNKMGIEVSGRWFGLWPSRTNIHVFEIDNPRGFKGSAFKAEEVSCHYHLGKLFGEPRVIDLIEVDHSTLTIDFPDPYTTVNNWTSLEKTMRKQKSSAKILIKKLVLKDFNVALHGRNYVALPKQTHFDLVEFDNISSREGFPTARLIRMIFQTGGIEQYIENLFNPEQDIEGVLSPFGF